MKVTEAAKKWNLTVRRVQQFCNLNMIEGAFKNGKSWWIPNDAVCPNDIVDDGIEKFKTIDEIKNEKALSPISYKKPLPIGTTNYKKIYEDYYFVDKTLIIKDLIDDKPGTILFTRPHLHGKSFILDMVKTYFEKSNDDTSRYFENTNIWKQDDFYKSYQNKYPVISLSFKDLRMDSYESFKSALALKIKNVYNKYLYAIKSDNTAQDYFAKLLNSNVEDYIIANSVAKLCEIITTESGLSPLVLIDDYDAPLDQAYISSYYDKASLIMRNFYTSTFSENKNIFMGIIMGTTTFEKNSALGGLDSIVSNTIISKKYNEYFGYTKSETIDLLSHKGLYYSNDVITSYSKTVLNLYTIFSPFSINSYAMNLGNIDNYFKNSGNASLLYSSLTNVSRSQAEDLVFLSEGGSLITYIDFDMDYLKSSKESFIYTYLVMNGYLTLSSNSTENGYYEISISNSEMNYAFNYEVLSRLNSKYTEKKKLSFREEFLQDVEEKILHDNKKEKEEFESFLL